MNTTTKRECCETPRKTVSVSTRKGRRAICNSCGAPWPKTEAVHQQNDTRGWEERVLAFLAHEIPTKHSSRYAPLLKIVREALAQERAEAYAQGFKQGRFDTEADFSQEHGTCWSDERHQIEVAESEARGRNAACDYIASKLPWVAENDAFELQQARFPDSNQAV